jgi:phage-related minor tail protein
MDDDASNALIDCLPDIAVFKGEVDKMRGALETGLGAGADAAARRIESALVRAVRTGKLSFEDLKATALSVLADIAAMSVRAGLQALIGGKSGGGDGGLLASLLGSPGRATGGPVSPGRAYVVGERGPELFVPTSSGRVEAAGAGGGGGRDVRVTITVQAGAGEAPAALQRSGRQVARAVRAALEV